MKEVKLPSGATLKISIAPFAQGKALYQAVLKEIKEVDFSSKTEFSTLYRDLFCVGASSQVIESAIWECFKRCTYNSGSGDLRITPDTFEPIEARDDYLTACMEVAKENIAPFVKSLYAEYGHFFQATKPNPA